MKEDLHFISGDFLEMEIPKKQQFLLKYFKTDVQCAFLKYFLLLGNWRNFVDHTGHHCKERYLIKMEKRYHQLMDVHQEASSVLDEDHMKMLQKLVSGKYKLIDLD